jgi:peptide chain release factor 3
MGDINSFKKPSQSRLMKDQFERPMILCNDIWEKNYAIKENPDHELRDYA